MNVVFALVTAVLIWLNKRHNREAHSGMDHEMRYGIGMKRIIALLFLAVLVIGLVSFFVTNGLSM
jgi:hypothetical protein